MKSQFLSIFSNSNEQNSATPHSAGTQPSVTSYRGRYQEFLNQQAPAIPTRPYRTSSSFRLLQGLFSFAIFIVLFVTILTLFGFGLSSLGVIARVSPSETAASSKQLAQPTQNPPAKAEPKRKTRRQ